jgi:Flp pilus assembly protein TadB
MRAFGRRRRRRAVSRWEQHVGKSLGDRRNRGQLLITGLASLAAAGAGAAAWGPAAAAIGIVPAAVLPRLLAAAERRDARLTRRQEEERQLAGALDLLAACLAAGAPVMAAVASTAVAIGGPLGARLGRVAAALDAGAGGSEAWRAATDDDAAPALAWVAHGVLRTSRSGSSLAPWLAAIATQAREESRLASVRQAERAGVLAVLPLGLCALPAYLLLGVVPAVAGLLQRLR